MENPKVKVGAVFLLMLAMSASSPPAYAQDQLFRKKDEWRKPEEKRAGKLDFFLKASEVYSLTGAGLDLATTGKRLVMDKPEIVRRTDGTVLKLYPIETGWAGRFGKRNAPAVIGAVAGLDVGIDLISRGISRHGGRWGKILAIALNLWKGTDNMAAGFHNMNQTPILNERIRATGYTRPVIRFRH